MLHEHVLMEDIDVDHWRNLQELLIVSAKERSRIVVIHEGGHVLKCTHSDLHAVNGAVNTVDDPHDLAKALYAANRDTVDLVVVFERDGFDAYFAQVQDEWSPEEDLDEYVRRAYATMNAYPDAIVTYPGPANTQLGLQWQLGASFDAVEAAVATYAPANGTSVLGVFEGDDLWATLVLGFDDDKKIDILTTVDPSLLTLAGDKAAVAGEISAWVSTTYRECSLSLFTDRDGAKELLDSPDKAAVLRSLDAADRLIVDRAPAELANLL